MYDNASMIRFNKFCIPLNLKYYLKKIHACIYLFILLCFSCFPLNYIRKQNIHMNMYVHITCSVHTNELKVDHNACHSFGKFVFNSNHFHND